MDIAQNLSLFIILISVSFIGLVLSIYYIFTRKGKWGYLLAPLSLFIDIFLFYAVLFLETYANIYVLGAQQLLIWSGLARLHGLLVILTYLIVEPKRSG